MRCKTARSSLGVVLSGSHAINLNRKHTAVGTPKPVAPDMIFPALLMIPGKLVAKITSGAFVEMRELIPDNLHVTLRRTMEIQDEFRTHTM